MSELLSAAVGLALLAQTVTLRDAVSQALEKNAAIAAASAQEDAARARLDEAKTMALPRVEASQSIVRSDNPVFVFGSLLEQGRFAPRHFDPAFLNDPDPLTNARFALNVRVPLFDQWRRRTATRQAQQGVEQAALGGEEVRQRIRAEVIGRFYGLLLAEEKRRVAEEAVKSAEADASAMRDRFEQGLLVESDILAAEVQSASFRQRLIESEGDMAVARAALATLLQTSSVDASGALPARDLAAIALDDALARGVAARADVRAAARATKIAELQLDASRSTRLPRVDAFGSFGASTATLTGFDPDHAVGVSVAVDLFDAGRAARNAESRSGIAAAKANEQAARDRATMEIVAAWHRTHAAHERIGVAEKSVARAEAAARIVHDRYDEGLTTITEQLRAQTALVAARLELLAARYDYVTGYAELQRAMGGLTDVEEY